MSDKTEVIGVAGCGAMGLPMARRLRQAGYSVWTYDVRPATEFYEFAPRMLGSAAELSDRCDVLLSVVRDQVQTEALLFAETGLLQESMRGQTLILSSTLDPN